MSAPPCASGPRPIWAHPMCISVHPGPVPSDPGLSGPGPLSELILPDRQPTPISSPHRGPSPAPGSQEPSCPDQPQCPGQPHLATWSCKGFPIMTGSLRPVPPRSHALRGHHEPVPPIVTSGAA